MQFEERENGSVLVIKPMAEQVVAANAALFKNHLMAKISAGSNRMVVDLALVDFLDSSGLTALISVFKAIKTSQGGELVLASLGQPLQSLLRLTGLQSIIRSFAGPEEACLALGQSG